MNSSKQQRRYRRQLRRYFTKTERNTNLYKRLTQEHELKYLVEQSEMMEAWCAKNRKSLSLLRLNNWLKKAKEWKEQRGEVDMDEVERQERKRAKELNELSSK